MPPTIRELLNVVHEEEYTNKGVAAAEVLAERVEAVLELCNIMIGGGDSRSSRYLLAEAILRQLNGKR